MEDGSAELEKRKNEKDERLEKNIADLTEEELVEKAGLASQVRSLHRMMGRAVRNVSNIFQTPKITPPPKARRK